MWSTGATGLVLAAATTDFFAISGANGRVITILRIIVGGVATAATSASVLLIKRTTLNTGGTATNPSGVTRDTALTGTASAGAVVSAYTANPTTGTATAPTGGTLGAYSVALGTATAPVAQTVIADPISGMLNIVLRNATDQLCLNLNAATIAGATLNITIEWQEG